MLLGEGGPAHTGGHCDGRGPVAAPQIRSRQPGITALFLSTSVLAGENGPLSPLGSCHRPKQMAVPPSLAPKATWRRQTASWTSPVVRPAERTVMVALNLSANRCCSHRVSGRTCGRLCPGSKPTLGPKALTRAFWDVVLCPHRPVHTSPLGEGPARVVRGEAGGACGRAGWSATTEKWCPCSPAAPGGTDGRDSARGRQRALLLHVSSGREAWGAVEGTLG